METEKQQKLGKCITPRDASQVSSPVALSLNKEETLSEQSGKTFSNNSDENQSSSKTKHNLRVYVTNLRGEPLMPTTPRKAKKLIKQKKAKVVSCKPFTIQLTQATGEAKQPINLDIDSGYSFIGYSAKTDKKELISGELELLKGMSKRLDNKRKYRRGKRNRLWYRQPRFLNRVSTKKKGWLAPSIQHKLDSHIKLINKIKSLLPITSTTIEVATFDTQKMVNPEISGIEYQRGTLQGYNIRNYLLEKFNRTCVYCKKKNLPLEIEHLTPKSRGGTNRIVNLAISCHNCNQKKRNQTCEEFGHPQIRKKADKSFKSATFMNLVRTRIVEKLNCDKTFGYITKHNRIKLGLPKTHYNDAFAISGIDQERCKPFFGEQVRRNNRCLQINRKGYKPSIRRTRYNLRPNDVVLLNGVSHLVKGVFSYGKCIRLINGIGETINTNIQNVRLLRYGKMIF